MYHVIEITDASGKSVCQKAIKPTDEAGWFACAKELSEQHGLDLSTQYYKLNVVCWNGSKYETVSKSNSI